MATRNEMKKHEKTKDGMKEIDIMQKLLMKSIKNACTLTTEKMKNLRFAHFQHALQVVSNFCQI